MLTRCPRCDTTFRVTPEQLKARHGRVRCGHCQDVFNALDTLVEATPAHSLPEISPATPREEPAAALYASEPKVEFEATAEAASGEVPESPGETAQPVAESEVSGGQDSETPPTDAEPADADSATVSIAEPESGNSEPEPGDAEPEPMENAEPIPASVQIEPDEWAAPPLEPLLHESPKRRVWLWAVGCVIAVVALSLQAAIHYRTEIAVLYPAAKPVLVAACTPLGCEVSLPRKSDLIGIETSNLSPDSSGKLSLTATLKNRAPFAQQYPDLELTLTDTSDQPLARRILAPADYLPAGTNVATGFAARGELSVNLSVDAPGVPAAGYRLYLFYP